MQHITNAAAEMIASSITTKCRQQIQGHHIMLHDVHVHVELHTPKHWKTEDTDCQDLNAVSPSHLITAYLIAKPACQTQVLRVTVHCTLKLSHGKVHSTHITNFSGLLQTVPHLLHQLYTLFVRCQCIGIVTYCCIHMTCRQWTLTQAGQSTVEHGNRSVVKAFNTGPFKVSEQCLSHLWQRHETKWTDLTAYTHYNTEYNNKNATKLLHTSWTLTFLKVEWLASNEHVS